MRTATRIATAIALATTGVILVAAPANAATDTSAIPASDSLLPTGAQVPMLLIWLSVALIAIAFASVVISVGRRRARASVSTASVAQPVAVLR